MATAKQLAALKKARAARAKNLKKSAPKKKATSKRKSNPVKSREKYVVYVVNRSRKFYFTGKDTLDTNLSLAKVFSSKLHAFDVASVIKLFGRDAKVGKKS